MGSEDLFHKKQAKRQRNTKPDHRFLVICEGEKTEQLYFKAMARGFNLGRNVEFVHKGITPSQILKNAKRHYKDEAQKGNPYTKVYLVFDRDQHACFLETYTQIKKIKDFHSIISNPCFEYWFLLYFEDTNKSYAYTEGGEGIAHPVIEALKEHLPDYEKNNSDILDLLESESAKSKLQGCLEKAKKRAKKIRKEFEKSGDCISTSTYTSVDELVEFLEGMQKE